MMEGDHFRKSDNVEDDRQNPWSALYNIYALFGMNNTASGTIQDAYEALKTPFTKPQKGYPDFGLKDSQLAKDAGGDSLPEAGDNIRLNPVFAANNSINKRPSEELGLEPYLGMRNPRTAVQRGPTTKVLEGLAPLQLQHLIEMGQGLVEGASPSNMFTGTFDPGPTTGTAMMTIGATPFGKIPAGPGKVLGVGPAKADIMDQIAAYASAAKSFNMPKTDLLLAQQFAKQGKYDELAKLYSTSDNPKILDYIDTLPQKSKYLFDNALDAMHVDTANAMKKAPDKANDPELIHQANQAAQFGNYDYLAELYHTSNNKGVADIVNNLPNQDKHFIQYHPSYYKPGPYESVPPSPSEAKSPWKIQQEALAAQKLAEKEALPKAREFIPQAERERRAQLGGFTEDVFHGTKYDPFTNPQLDTRAGGYSGFFTAKQPELADMYAGTPAKVANREVTPTAEYGESVTPQSQVIPMKLKIDNYHSVDAGGSLWAGPGGDIMSHAIKQALKEKKDGVIVRNIYDEPAGDTTHLGAPKDVYIVLKGNTARSRYADFDPSKFHLNDLLASGAAIAAPAGLATQLFRGQDGSLHSVHPVDHDPFKDEM